MSGVVRQTLVTALMLNLAATTAPAVAATAALEPV